MSDALVLATIRAVHTVIYGVMAVSTFVLLYAGLTGDSGMWLWIALGLLSVEVAVFVGNGMSCPLTSLAQRYGAVGGYAFDLFLPERITRHTFRFFTSVMLIGLALLVARWGGLLG